jgi:hypothetical protein
VSDSPINHDVVLKEGDQYVLQHTAIQNVSSKHCPVLQNAWKGNISPYFQTPV